MHNSASACREFALDRSSCVPSLAGYRRAARFRQREVVVRLSWLLAFAALIGSRGEAHASHSGLALAPAPHAYSQVGPKLSRFQTPSDEELIQRDYPWRLYLHYPQSIRPELRRADLEHGLCVGARPDQRACNRMDRVVHRLERRGWCWGSEDPMASEAEKRWLRCSRIPHYRRGR